MPLLPALRDLFAGPEGPKQRVIAKQQSLFPLLPDLRLEVPVGKFGQRPTTIPGGVLQLILLACARRLFVPKEDEEEVRLVNDMFRQFARCREVCSAFYLAMLDCWPLLQEEFVEGMAAFMKTDPQNRLRMPFDCVAHVMNTIDPSLSRSKGTGLDLMAAAGALCWTFHERLKRHLRYHCAPYLMMLLSNDTKINEGKIKDTKTIPTLSGFASYLHTAFGDIIRESIKTGYRNETIVLFYESEGVPAWNMLPGGNGTKNLQGYLDGVARDPAMGKLICAPADLFPHHFEWPELSEVGSLETYIFEEREMVMPPIRQVKKEVLTDGTLTNVTLVAEITLPMRLLLRPIFCPETNKVIEWSPQFDYYTMNVTTGMLTQSSWLEEMPREFEIIDHLFYVINATSALNTGASLTADYFATWADVMLSYSATTCFRWRVNNLPLLHNFFNVQESIKNLLPDHLYRDTYIEDRDYNSSPIQQDWGNTYATAGDFWHVVLDDEFVEQFNNPTANPARTSWAMSTFFDMSPGFMKEAKAFEMDPTTVLSDTNIRHTIWDERLKAVDIGALMSKLDISWPRHQFNSADLAVKISAKQEAPPVAQATGVDTQGPKRRPSVMISNSSINRARRRAQQGRG